MDLLLLVPFLVILLFAVINGAVRGLKRSLVRLVFIVIAGVAAFFLTPVLSQYLAKREAIVHFENYGKIMEYAAISPSLDAVIKGTPKAIWSIAVYPVVFILLCFLMAIPGAIINRKIEKTKKGSGALVGIVIAVLTFSLAFSPLCKIGSILMDTIPDVLIDKDEISELCQYYGLSVDVDKLLKYDRVMRIEAIGGEKILDYQTTVKGNGKKISITKELCNLLPLYSQFDKVKSAPIELLGLLADCSDNSEFLNDVFSDVQSAARSKWSDNEPYLGYDPKNPDGGVMEYVCQLVTDNPTNMTIRQFSDRISSLFQK